MKSENYSNNIHLLTWKHDLIQDELNLYKEYLKNNSVTSCDGWILRTLGKERFHLLRNADKIVLIGSGLYPYSLINAYAAYKRPIYIGVEKIKILADFSKALLRKHNLPIIIYNCDGLDFDYSLLTNKSLVFLSNDISNLEITYKFIKNKLNCPVFVYLPYKKAAELTAAFSINSTNSMIK